MKKSPFQISNFLSQHAFKSEKEWKRIVAICLSDEGVRLDPCYTIDAENGITLHDFLDWMDNKFGPGDICNLDGQLVICGICHFNAAVIVGMLSDDKILTCERKVAQNGLKTTSEGEYYNFMNAMLKSELQFSRKEMALVKKYKPQPGDRVIFTTPQMSGLGVIKSLHPDTDSVDYFCYYINETGEVGYSMNEIGITKLSEVIFEPMNNSPQRQTKGNGLYLQRKLNKKLSQFGKVWNDKLHRIEPLDPMVPVGERYWYINDKLEVLSDIEHGRIASKRRYLAANYFKSQQEAMTYQGKIRVILNERYGLPDPKYTEK